MRNAWLTLMAALMVVTVCGCSVHAGSDDESTNPPTVSGEKVAEMTDARLMETQVGLLPGTVDCPDLDVEVGASVTCLRTIETGGVYWTIDVTVEVTEVDREDEDFSFHIQVADSLNAYRIRGEWLERRAAREVTTLYGARPTAVDCRDLPRVQGEQRTCSLTVQGERKRMRIRVTELYSNAFTLRFAIEGHHRSVDVAERELYPKSAAS